MHLHYPLTDLKELYDNKRSRYIIVQDAIDILRGIDNDIIQKEILDDKILNKISLYILQTILLEDLDKKDIFERIENNEEKK